MGLGRGMALDIAVVDDDPAVRDSLATFFEREGCSVQTYEGGDAFLKAVEQGAQCDCLILDLHMPVLSGLDVLKAIGGARYPTPVLMISGRADIPMAVAAIKAGAYDFIEKPLEAEAMIERVQDAVRAYNDRPSRGVSAPESRCFRGADMLTSREREVLEQIIQGASNKEAGRILGISPRTVEVHRARIMEKLCARNTADLMRIVLWDGERI